MGKKSEEKKQGYEDAWMEGEPAGAAPLSDAVVRAREAASKDEREYVAARREMDAEEAKK